jgi:hypothetical protein
MREPSQEPSQDRLLPIQLDVRDPALGVEEIRRPLAKDLMGERRVPVLGEACGRPLHAGILASDRPRRKTLGFGG